jgi:hypothetical protein
MSVPALNRLPRAWYGAQIAEFLGTAPEAIIGQLVNHANVAIDRPQTGAWLEQVRLLKQSLTGLSGQIYFEFTIPRMGRRVDVVLLLGPVVFVLEFKVGAQDFGRSAIEQVWDYALDLKNFHEASHAAPIVPVLVATEASESHVFEVYFAADAVCRPIAIAPGDLRRALDQLVSLSAAYPALDAQAWADSPYRPTPTIVEAARALYAQHSVENIARHDAGAVNLHRTSHRVEELIEVARRERQKIICFVTGVPGAGKTLVGLNVATLRREEDSTHAVFLSGNGPLVAVLREALTRDDLARRRAAGERTTKGRVANPVKAFIQNVHHFRDEALRDITRAPHDHVVIFDEAQRAWTRQKAATFMKVRKGQPDFRYSEPAFLISYLDRHSDWAMIICLVGGGQEIHTGEAGITEWLDAVRGQFGHWHLYISDQLQDSEYAAGHALDLVRSTHHAHFDQHLHLAVSMRSFRAEHVSTFVKALLDREVEEARRALGWLGGRYPIALTRDLARAKRWVREQARGSERFGLVASSKAMRLKPYAIDIRVAADPVCWFLNDRHDTRSSYYLEDCATEFQVQGLELDWTCVNWDADLRMCGSDWSYHDFKGDRWQNIRSPENRNYLRNAYRVLLTRARQGMVLFIPPGDTADPTRAPEFYDSTFDYLANIGLPVID